MIAIIVSVLGTKNGKISSCEGLHGNCVVTHYTVFKGWSPALIDYGTMTSKRHRDAFVFSWIDSMTERKTSKPLSDDQRKLQAIAKQYKLIFDLSPDAMLIGNSSGEFIDVNESATLQTGYTKEELLGRPMSSLFSEDELTKKPLRYDLIKKGEILRIERNLTRKDGSPVPVEMHSRMLPNGDLMAVIRDNADRKKMARNLEDLLERQKVIIDAAFEAIFISVKGVCVGQNRKAEEMFGYRDEEAVGRLGTDWIIPEERDKVMENIVSGYEGSYESVGLRKDGSSFPVEIQARMTAYNGEIARVTALRDITLRKKAENDLLTIQKLESLGTLAGGLAHDLNNILTGLFGNLSLAKIKLDSGDPAYTFISNAEDSLTRFTHITNKLLTFSKGGQPVIEHVELPELVEEIVKFDLAGSNVIPHFERGQQLWHAKVDKGQIQQVFSNLTINANQAMSNGGTLHISFSNCDNSANEILNLAPGLYVKAEVKDEGEGIAPENLPNIFDPYFSTKSHGSGLGLTSVHSIISQHNGLISTRSKVGRGTAFTIYLPASRENRHKERSKKQYTTDTVVKNYKILLVDDDDEVCSVCEILLKSLNCSVVTAKSRSQALDKFIDAQKRNQPFDVAILDLTIPGESGGAETAEQLLQIDPGIQMIVSSGYSDDPVMANYSEYGFSAILPKPYTLEKLKDALILL